MEQTPFTFIDSVARETLVLERDQPKGDRPTGTYHWMRWLPTQPAPRRAR